jgi:hypothetical protein
MKFISIIITFLILLGCSGTPSPEQPPPTFNHRIDDLSLLSSDDLETAMRSALNTDILWFHGNPNYQAKPYISKNGKLELVFKGTNATFVYEFYIEGNHLLMRDFSRPRDPFTERRTNPRKDSSTAYNCTFCNDRGFRIYLYEFQSQLLNSIRNKSISRKNYLVTGQKSRFNMAVSSNDFKIFIQKYKDQDVAKLISKAEMKLREAIEREENEDFKLISTHIVALGFIHKYKSQDFANLIPKATVLADQLYKKEEVVLNKAIEREQNKDFKLISTSNMAVNFIKKYLDQDFANLISKATELMQQLSVKEEIELKKWQSALNVGDNTFCGYIVQINGPMLKIAVIAELRGFGSEKWLHKKFIYPPKYGCQNSKGELSTLYVF